MLNLSNKIFFHLFQIKYNVIKHFCMFEYLLNLDKKIYIDANQNIYLL